MDYKKYFDMLVDWKKLPAYRLEPRIDSLFGYFLADFIHDIKAINISQIIPELPIRLGTVRPELNGKNYADRSYKVDFYALAQNGLNLFVEVKSDSGSRRDEQDDYLYKSKVVGMKSIVEGILQISKVSSYKKKYNHLLSKMKNIGLLDNSNNYTGTSDIIEIIYIQPQILDKDKGKTIIDFGQISAWLQNKYPKNDFAVSFAAALKTWAKD